ncbi:MAG: ABC transporter permease [Ruminiclostridium sp.]|nr:ABC transporter permease [Ruminiclostridium sp.]
MKTKGWKEVLAFTFIQQVKTKSFIISTIVIALIVALMAATANILPTFFLDSSLSGEASPLDSFTVRTLYLDNETEYAFDFTEALKPMAVTIKPVTAAEADAKAKELTDTAEQAMLTRITVVDDMFSIDSQYAGGDSGVTKGDCDAVTQTVSGEMHAQFLLLSGLPQDKLATALSGVSVTVSCAGEEPESMVSSVIKSVVPMLSSIVLFIFIFSYSQLVAQSVAIEKSSRIVEYLLTSIKPLALIIGKVIAMCLVSLMQFIIIGLGGGLGFLISMPFGIFTKIDKLVEAAGGAALTGNGLEAQGILGDITKAFSNVDAMALVIMILTFVFGFLLFAGMAGIAGASVSKMEDLASAIQPLSIIGVLGFYLAYFPQVTPEENSMAVVARYVPISSPFILPSDYMLGKIGLPEALLSIAILIAADIGIMVLVAKVYENIIVHTGSRLKLGDMLKMSK